MITARVLESVRTVGARTAGEDTQKIHLVGAKATSRTTLRAPSPSLPPPLGQARQGAAGPSEM